MPHFGQSWAGEPCVWCGGGQCHTGDDSLCAPFDYLEKAGIVHVFARDRVPMGARTTGQSQDTRETFHRKLPSCDQGVGRAFGAVNAVALTPAAG